MMQSATNPKQDGRRRPRAPVIEFNGRTQGGTAWARELGIDYRVLRWRLDNWSLERALTTPKMRHGNRGQW